MNRDISSRASARVCSVKRTGSPSAVAIAAARSRGVVAAGPVRV